MLETSRCFPRHPPFFYTAPTPLPCSTSGFWPGDVTRLFISPPPTLQYLRLLARRRVETLRQNHKDAVEHAIDAAATTIQCAERCGRARRSRAALAAARAEVAAAAVRVQRFWRKKLGLWAAMAEARREVRAFRGRESLQACHGLRRCLPCTSLSLVPLLPFFLFAP